MTDRNQTTPTPPPPPPPSQPDADPVSGPSPFDVISPYLHPGRENVMLNYVLYLAGLVPAFGIVPIIVGFALALINRPNAKGMWADHYAYQVRTAGIGLLYAFISAILVLAFGLGIILLILTAVWWIVRSIKGLIAASHHQTVPDPQTWSW